jgi:hypothetical protein
MEFLDPVLGAITGTELVPWRSILAFSIKVLFFCLPFIILGFLVEKDVIRVPAASKTVKSLVLLICVIPILMFAGLNYIAPKLQDSFWEVHPVLELFWIMEGSFAPLILAGLCLVYVSVYIAEIARGDLRD